MSLHSLTNNPEWDCPIYKKLARNDTGEAPGHQGGMVIPKNLRIFFPGLPQQASPDNPTVDHRIIADLYIDDEFNTRVNTRYQYQTWGGTRSPESRLTESLGPIRNLARGDDYILIQRNLADLEYYRLILVKQNSPYYQEVERLAGINRWGVLGDVQPMSESQYQRALTEEEHREHSNFELFDNEAQTNETRSIRIARSVVFRQTIKRIYSENCCICQTGLKIPGGFSEVEAAHIVPRRKKGSDDARNGMSLCKRHHWAFDHGLFGVGDNRVIIIPDSVIELPENRELIRFREQVITEPNNPNLRPDEAALRWHRENILIT